MYVIKDMLFNIYVKGIRADGSVNLCVQKKDAIIFANKDEAQDRVNMLCDDRADHPDQWSIVPLGEG